VKTPRGLPEHLTALRRPLVMGILNVTPDSFSDGGLFYESSQAIAHGISLIENGADMVDVGGESTRPGAQVIDAHEEQRRVIDVVSALSKEGIPVSIDTMHAATALRAVDAGACLINDVSGGRADSSMYSAVAQVKVPYVLMHWRGHDVRANTDYSDVIADIRHEFQMACELAFSAGIEPDYLVMDPGIGFSKNAQANWEILANVDHLTQEYPVLIGASRKRFLGELLAEADSARPVGERDLATHVVSALVGQVWGIRVHDPYGTRDAIAVAQALRGASRG
jgi:dihydropteroate synthase